MRRVLTMLPLLREFVMPAPETQPQVGLPPLLESLSLHSTDLDAVMFASLTKLRKLTIKQCAGISAIKCVLPQLSHLEVFPEDYDYELFDGVTGSALTHLSLAIINVNTIRKLPRLAPLLREFSFGFRAGITAEAIAALDAPLLTKLEIDTKFADTMVKDDILAACAHFSSLVTLQLPSTASFTRAGFSALVKGDTAITELRVCRTRHEDAVLLRLAIMQRGNWRAAPPSSLN